MPTDELTQALDRLRFDEITSLEQIVAEVLDLDPRIVAKVLHAMERAQLVSGHQDAYMRTTEYRDKQDDWRNKYTPDFEVRKAIEYVIGTRVRRLLTSIMIRDDKVAVLAKKLFVAENDKGKICTGCPRQISCYAENYSTPEKCWTTVASRAKPLKLLKTDHVSVHVVDFDQTFIIPLDTLLPR